MIILRDISEYFMFLVFMAMLSEMVGVLKTWVLSLAFLMFLMAVLVNFCSLLLQGVMVLWLLVTFTMGLVKLLFL